MDENPAFLIGEIIMQFTKKGTVLQTNGTPIQVGDQLPAFQIQNQAGQTVTESDLIQRMTLISVVPNINTPVCSLSTRKFNDEVGKYQNVDFYTVSTNSIEEQQKWCALSNVSQMQMLSDRDHDFGEKMGLWIKDAGIDARSVWVIDSDGKVIYCELVKELSHEPNYDQVLEFLQNHQN